MLLLVGLYGVLLWEMFLLFVRGMPIVVRVLRPLVLLVLRFVVHVLLLMCLLRLLLMRLRLWWLVLRLRLLQRRLLRRRQLVVLRLGLRLRLLLWLRL